MGYNKSKFRLSEIFNNTDGKTSGSATVGVIMGLISIIAFIFVMIGWWINKPYNLEVFEKVLQLALLSTALLGVRKFSGAITGSKTSNKVENDSEVEEVKQ